MLKTLGSKWNAGSSTCRVLAAAAMVVCVAVPALAKDKKPGVPTQTIVTVVNHARGGSPAPVVTQADVIVKDGGKTATILGWQPLPNNATIQLVVLIDDALRGRSSANFSELGSFIQQLPPNVQVAVGYMQYGRAVIASGFTAGRVIAVKSIRVPTGIAGVNASPYFCISDLAKHWPDSGHPAAARHVLMITDGIDRYFEASQYDPEDPYVGTAIADAQKNRLIVSTIYFRDIGLVDRGNRGSFVGNDYLIQVAQATGGKDYFEGMGNPVTFVPMLREYTQRLASSYLLTYAAQGSGLKYVKISTKVHDVRLAAPDHVLVGQQIPVQGTAAPTSVAELSR
jgi:hypothetical protein